MAGVGAAAASRSGRVGRPRGSGCVGRRCSASPRSAAGVAARERDRQHRRRGRRGGARALPRRRDAGARWRSSRRWPPAAAIRSPARSARRGDGGRGRARRSRRVPPGTPGAMSLEGTAAGSGRRRWRSDRLAPRSASCRSRRSLPIVAGATVGALRRERARRHARSTGYPQQRHAEFPEHRRRGRAAPSPWSRGVSDAAASAPARALAAVHAGRAGARLRVRRGHRGRRRAARDVERRTLLLYPLIGAADGGGAERRRTTR